MKMRLVWPTLSIVVKKRRKPHKNFLYASMHTKKKLLYITEQLVHIILHSTDWSNSLCETKSFFFLQKNCSTLLVSSNADVGKPCWFLRESISLLRFFLFSLIFLYIQIFFCFTARRKKSALEFSFIFSRSVSPSNSTVVGKQQCSPSIFSLCAMLSSLFLSCGEEVG